MDQEKEKPKHEELRRGAMVKALLPLDVGVADVRPGDIGVVFEERGAFGDGNGPMVRWMSGSACNVYQEHGDVLVLMQ